MHKRAMYSTLILAIVGAAGGSLYMVLSESRIEEVRSTESTSVSSPRISADETKRKKIESIGSVRDLEPVEIPNGPAR